MTIGSSRSIDHAAAIPPREGRVAPKAPGGVGPAFGGEVSPPRSLCSRPSPDGEGRLAARAEEPIASSILRLVVDRLCRRGDSAALLLDRFDEFLRPADIDGLPGGLQP